MALKYKKFSQILEKASFEFSNFLSSLVNLWLSWQCSHIIQDCGFSSIFAKLKSVKIYIMISKSRIFKLLISTNTYDLSQSISIKCTMFNYIEFLNHHITLFCSYHCFFYFIFMFIMPFWCSSYEWTSLYYKHKHTFIQNLSE